MLSAIEIIGVCIGDGGEAGLKKVVGARGQGTDLSQARSEDE